MPVGTRSLYLLLRGYQAMYFMSASDLYVHYEPWCTPATSVLNLALYQWQVVWSIQAGDKTRQERETQGVLPQNTQKKGHEHMGAKEGQTRLPRYGGDVTLEEFRRLIFLSQLGFHQPL